MKTDSPADNQSKVLELLDQAYAISGETDNFDHMIDAARAYFFETSDNNVLSPSVPRYAGLDPYLERHIPRLEKMMGESTPDSNLGLSLEQHARLHISKNGIVTHLNAHARKLIGGTTGQAYDTLALSYDSIKTIKDLIASLRASSSPVQRIIYLQTDHDSPVNTFAYCRSVSEPAGDLVLALNFAQFEWTDALIEKLETALGLTTSESHVLRGTLMGLTQKDIALSRDRSVDTIKSQAKAVLRKSGCSKMGDLVHLSTSIAYVISLAENKNFNFETSEDWITPTSRMTRLPVTKGRILAFYEYGPKDGRPVLFIHGFAQGPFFTQAMRSAFHTHNLRIIAPSRPGFGHSSPSLSRHNFDQTVIEDTQALLGHLNVDGPLLLVTHHGGVSHAFRIAAHLGDYVSSMVMIGAGIPITAQHIKTMERQTQLAAVATRHAPSIMKMTLSLGLKAYKKKGAEAFLRKLFSADPADLKTLQNPEMLQIQKWGCYFLTQQGVETFIRDGSSAMSDWSQDFDAVNNVQHWLHGRECPVMGAQYVQDYISAKTNYPVDILDGTGFNVLHTHGDVVVKAMVSALET